MINVSFRCDVIKVGSQLGIAPRYLNVASMTPLHVGTTCVSLLRGLADLQCTGGGADGGADLL